MVGLFILYSYSLLCWIIVRCILCLPLYLPSSLSSSSILFLVPVAVFLAPLVSTRRPALHLRFPWWFISCRSAPHPPVSPTPSGQPHTLRSAPHPPVSPAPSGQPHTLRSALHPPACPTPSGQPHTLRSAPHPPVSPTPSGQLYTLRSAPHPPVSPTPSGPHTLQLYTLRSAPHPPVSPTPSGQPHTLRSALHPPVSPTPSGQPHTLRSAPHPPVSPTPSGQPHTLWSALLIACTLPASPVGPVPRSSSDPFVETLFCLLQRLLGGARPHCWFCVGAIGSYTTKVPDRLLIKYLNTCLHNFFLKLINKMQD